MIRLALDTSTMTQTVALFDGDRMVDHTLVELRGGHSRVLYDTVRSALSRRRLDIGDLDAIVVGIGPGSFTGLRIGLALAHGMAFAHNLPITPVPSLESVAALLPPGGHVAVAVDARMQEVYATAVSTTPPWDPVVSADTWDPAAFAEACALLDGPLWCVGNGFDAWAAPLAPLSSRARAAGLLIRGPDAAALVPWADARGIQPQPAHTVEPRYIRRSEAERNRTA